jgi:monoamine oxidase
MHLLSQKYWVSFLSILSFCGLIVGSSEAMETVRTCDVAIIGGGMAGLTTAYKLNKKGISCCLFEAKGYSGGRTHTHYFTEDKSQYYEEGGTTIDHDHNNVINLADELGVDLYKVPFGEGEISIFQNGQRLSDKELIDALEKSEQLFTKAVKPSYSATNNKFESVMPIIDMLDSENVKNFWKAFILDECGIEPIDTPIYQLEWLAEKAKEYKQALQYRGSVLTKWLVNMYYTYQVQGGMSNLVNALQKKCLHTTFYFEHPLQKIYKNEAGYHLEFLNQPPVIAKKVVMAIPFSTLRDVTVDSSVDLGFVSRLAIKNLHYGTNAKIGIPVHGKFEMLYHVNIGPKDIFTAWPGKNAVTIFLGGEAGKNLTYESALRLVEDEKANLESGYPKIGKFDKPAIKNWTQDPYAKGSYSAHTTMNDDFRNVVSIKYPLLCEYAEPINNDTFVFAGEHTIYGKGRAHIEGAVLSGELAAQIISAKTPVLLKKQS